MVLSSSKSHYESSTSPRDANQLRNKVYLQGLLSSTPTTAMQYYLARNLTLILENEMLPKTDFHC